MATSPKPRRLPGAWLTLIARALFHDDVLEQVVHPTITDLQNEWIEAGTDHRQRRLAMVRGYVAFWSLVIRAPVAFRNWTNDTSNPAGFFQRVWRFEMTMATRLRFTALLIALGLGAGYASSYFAPVLYQSTAVLQVQPSEPAPGLSDPASAARPSDLVDRLLLISQGVVSRTHVEQLIDEFGLYKQEGLAIQDAVELMRRRLAFLPSTQAPGQIRVSFVDQDPRMAMRVAERVAAVFIGEGLKERERTPSDLERRQNGVQFKLIDSARLPTSPIGPSRYKFTLAGGVAGLMAAVVFMLIAAVWRFVRDRRGVLKPTTA